MAKDTHFSVKEKAAEVGVSEVTKKILEYTLIPAIPLVLGLVPQVRDRMLAVLSPGQIAAILAISMSLNLASVLYLLHLRRLIRSALDSALEFKPIARWGIWWDAEANPLCPSCKTLMQLRGTGPEEKLRCDPCRAVFTLKTDTGGHVQLAEAKSNLLRPATID
jgi:hypothetical protein